MGLDIYSQTKVYSDITREVSAYTLFNFPELWAKLLSYTTPVLLSNKNSDALEHCLNLLVIELKLNHTTIQAIKLKHFNKYDKRIKDKNVYKTKN